MAQNNVWTEGVETQWELVEDPGWEEGLVKPGSLTVAKREKIRRGRG